MKLHTSMMLNNITTSIRCREAHVGMYAVLIMATMSGKNKCMRYKWACVYAAHGLAHVQHIRKKLQHILDTDCRCFTFTCDGASW